MPDGSWDEDSPGIDVVQALEFLGKAFTGASSNFYDVPRKDQKTVCFNWGIPTPNYGFAFNLKDIEKISALLKYPMFVKPHQGYNSVGITKESKVTCFEELKKEALRVIGKYGGALVEEFIDGDEYSVLVVCNPKDDKAPITFQPIMCDFSGADTTFKTFQYKWNGPKNPWRPMTDPVLAEKLRKMTADAFSAMDGSGYARSDIRVDSSGNAYFLEMNANPSIFYRDDDAATADMILSLDGFGKKQFMDLIIRYAINRQKQKNCLPYEAIFSGDKGNHLLAKKNFVPGEIIVLFEEMPHRLVTKKWVDKHWSPKFRQFFVEYCWPISDDLWVMWDKEPSGWKPINHSCDPNAWVDGLNLVARKPIADGEQITMDYATMFTENMGPAFKCLCGADNCRGEWKGHDYKEDWFRQRYGDHVTDHVLQKLKLLGKL